MSSNQSNTPEVLQKLKLIGTMVRMQIRGHRTSVLITDYDSVKDVYHGEAHRNYSMNTGEKTPVVFTVNNIVPFPYTKRPDYAFQFVLCGEDEQPLIDIANGNVPQIAKDLTSDPFGKVPPSTNIPHEKGEVVEKRTPMSNENFDPADTNKDGKVSNQERKESKKH